MRYKDKIDSYNGFNRYINELKTTFIKIDKDSQELNKAKCNTYIHHCSRNICDGASKQPFKYICKYFNIQATEDTLIQLETVLNNFNTIEEGNKTLVIEKEEIISIIRKELPIVMKLTRRNRLTKKLGLEKLDIDAAYFPEFIFRYISPAGRSVMECKVVINIDTLNRYIDYMSDIIRGRDNAKSQRALMTSKLRKEILERDNYTCKYCGLSVREEPNLLLEVDHIIPISKGGVTSKDNLQTLCWRCNRSKGKKIVEKAEIIEN